MVKIQLNGRNLKLSNKYSIAILLKKYKIESKKVAVELNGKIINRNKYKLIYIKNKDKIEIVHFIGGG
ncbi:MAG: sulfur carrier protein ThiS [Proteobacteria bacterium]|jgi:sulfur carrier protein|nr:sulfur carrier protein ThiS [Pseudomonadota bacterium]